MRKRGDRAWYRPRRVHGRDCWEVCAVVGGGRPSTALVDTEREAIQEVDRLRRALKSERLPPRTWDEAVEAYIDNREMAKSSAATLRYRLRAVDLVLERHPLQLTTDDADRYRAERDAAATTVFHEMRAVQALQTWMVEQRWIREATWADARLPDKTRREEFLHPDEVGAFIRAAQRLSADPTLGEPDSNRLPADWCRWAAAAWIFFFGPRTSEVQRLRVRDIDLRSGIVWVYGTKSKASRRAFVVESELGLEVLRDTFRGVAPDARAFPTGRLGVAAANPEARTDWFAYRCAITCEVAGIRKVSPHALRHTVATEAIVEGADVASVQALLGHGSPRVTTETYSHAIAAVHSRAAARAIGTVLDRVVGGRPSLKVVP